MDTSRSQVFTGRERHVASARADFSPYPQRAIRTADYTLILNFHPERWPLGDPFHLSPGTSPDADALEHNTRLTHPDDDAGPTKSWLVQQRALPQWKPFYDLAYGKRPKYELYDLKADPHEMKNLADNPAHATVRADLEKRLLAELTRTGDPRVTCGSDGSGHYYETPPLDGPVEGDKP